MSLDDYQIARCVSNLGVSFSEYRDSDFATRQLLHEAANAIEAHRAIRLAELIRIAVNGKSGDFREYIADMKKAIPRRPMQNIAHWIGRYNESALLQFLFGKKP